MTRSRFLLALLLCLTLLLNAGCQTGEPTLPADSTKPPKLLLNDKPLTLSPAPILVQGKLLLPFKALMEALKIDYSEYGSTTLTTVHENRYVRIDLKEHAIYCNGKQFPSEIPPAVYTGAAYVSADVLLSCLNIPVQYPDSGTVSLGHSESEKSTALIDGEYFVPVDVPEDHLQFMIPKSWTRLPGAPYRFGQSNVFEDYSLRYERQDLKGQALDEILKQLVSQEQEAIHAKLTPVRRSTLVVNGLSGLSAAYSSDEAEPATQFLFYVMADDRNAYTFVGKYTAAANTATLEQVMSEAARSIHTGTIQVDTQQEHYLETPRFFEDGMRLSSPLYSNMEVSRQFPIKGTLKDKRINTLYAVVSRGDESLTFQIPVTDQSYDGLIDTPFGLGKHNVILYAAQDTYKPDDQILQFSVININRQITRWLIPTPLITTRDTYIMSQSSLLTYKSYGDFQKAQNIFRWIADGTTLVPGTHTPLRSARQVYLDNAGTEQEICYLYAALLRAAEIPARVVSGPKASERFWVEVQLNGRWISSDPALALQKQAAGLSLKDAVAACFNMPKAYYDEKYNPSETLQE